MSATAVYVYDLEWSPTATRALNLMLRSCSSVSFDFIVFIAYNHSVYQSWANNETNYINPTCKTYAIN